MRITRDVLPLFLLSFPKPPPNDAFARGSRYVSRSRRPLISPPRAIQIVRKAANRRRSIAVARTSASRKRGEERAREPLGPTTCGPDRVGQHDNGSENVDRAKDRAVDPLRRRDREAFESSVDEFR